MDRLFGERFVWDVSIILNLQFEIFKRDLDTAAVNRIYNSVRMRLVETSCQFKYRYYNQLKA